MKAPPCKACGRPLTWYWWAPGACEYLCDHCAAERAERARAAERRR